MMVSGKVGNITTQVVGPAFEGIPKNPSSHLRVEKMKIAKHVLHSTQPIIKPSREQPI
tara:strand:+ start:995 stop:1168 length:174 start_codon:yes stop_codon:yes gene_type:complete